jgi:3'-phosphoadenosine 5'-phosphosulfate sulfotransferase (PAPS reductase)/FAD synthetase
VSRTLVWFSAGAASAVAAKIMLAERSDVVIAYIDPGSEHPDNARFVDDCEFWYKHPVHRLKSERYRDTWEVWEKRRFLVGPGGALCTAELKKKVRYAFEQPDDIQVFGYTIEETDRADRFREQNPEVTLECPLIDHGLKKSDCKAILQSAGLELPEIYELGFHNANCVGCVKGGIGYWNHVRKVFPDVYWRMAKLEREIGHSVCHDKNGALWLDEMGPERGRHGPTDVIECSLLCDNTVRIVSRR